MQKSDNFRAGKRTMYTKKSIMQKQKYISLRWIWARQTNRYRCTTKSETSCKRIRGVHKQSSERLNNMLERYIKSHDIHHLPEEVGLENYWHQPPEAQYTEGHVWKLRKCVYGLSDTSMKWYGRVMSTMTELQGKLSSVDSALFTWHKGTELQGLIAVHVDAFLWSGNNAEFQSTIISKLCKTFTIGKEEGKCFIYFGVNIAQVSEQIIFDQEDYINALKPITIQRLQQPDEPTEKELLRSNIGQPLWISSQTRSDNSFDVSTTAINLANPKINDLITINKIFKITKGEFSFQQIAEPVSIIVYTNAAFGNLPEGGSQWAYLIFLTGKHSKCNLISWQSKIIRRVVRSSLAAETVAMAAITHAALYISVLYNEIMHGKSRRTPLSIKGCTDNKSLSYALKSSKYVTDRRLWIDIGALKELIRDKNDEEIKWFENKNQLGDAMTEKVSSTLKLISLLEKGHLQ